MLYRIMLCTVVLCKFAVNVEMHNIGVVFLWSGWIKKSMARWVRAILKRFAFLVCLEVLKGKWKMLLNLF